MSPFRTDQPGKKADTAKEQSGLRLGLSSLCFVLLPLHQEGLTLSGCHFALTFHDEKTHVNGKFRIIV